MKDTIVIDLDGTLADLTHRLPLIQRESPQWDKFFLAAGEDKVHREIRELMRVFVSDANYSVVIVSARPASISAITKNWLEANGVHYDEIYLLRGEKDYTPDDELKMKWLDRYGAERVLFVVDDRQRVVDMWRNKGVVCLQCRAWEEWKKPKGEKRG